jgi:fructosamine-3-kinase
MNNVLIPAQAAPAPATASAPAKPCSVLEAQSVSIYYGDHEADLAMTELFGGFGSEFYRAYRQEWPLDDGYPRRRTLYNLYHILNHLNLFGGGYAGQAEQMMDSLLV